MEDSDKIIDLGEWKVPVSWNDVDLKTFEAIEQYYSDKDKRFDVREVIHILCHKTVDEVNELPSEFLETIMTHLAFIKTNIDYTPSPSITINGEEYSINVQQKLKVGEYVSIDTITRANPYDYSSVLAVLCRKEGEIYDSKFEAEKFEERKEMFANTSAVKVMPLIGFFLNCYELQKSFSLLYSITEEQLNRIQKNLEDSHSVGMLKKRSLKRQMKTLRKLLESSKNT